MRFSFLIADANLKHFVVKNKLFYKKDTFFLLTADPRIGSQALYFCSMSQAPDQQLDAALQLDFDWLRVRHYVKDALGREDLPDLNAILFMIGVQEACIETDAEFTKEEKQDLMHIGTCTILSQDGYYDFIGRDEDGWPHFKNVRKLPKLSLTEQASLLKASVVNYFSEFMPQQQ